jgi:hypothetical protein
MEWSGASTPALGRGHSPGRVRSPEDGGAQLEKGERGRHAVQRGPRQQPLGAGRDQAAATPLGGPHVRSEAIDQVRGLATDGQERTATATVIPFPLPKLRTERSPNPPNGRPSTLPPMAWAASSITRGALCAPAASSARSREMSAGMPQ